MSEEKKFYVYGYVRETSSLNGPKGSFYYIGKGTGSRRFTKGKSEIRVPKRSNNVLIAESLYENDARQLEMLLIYLYGRLDMQTGCLRNLTDGGEGCSGRVVSNETRLKMRDAKIGRPSPRKGSKLSEETKKRISESKLGRKIKGWPEESRIRKSIAMLGNTNGCGRKGFTHTEYTKKRIGQSSLGRVCSDETKQRMRDAWARRRAKET